MFLNNTIQLKDSFRNVPVETSSKPKRHIMFVIAESDTEILAMPMDSVFNTITVRTKKIIANYPQSKEFELEINAFNYKRITVPSFINYKKATIIDKLKLDFLLQDYQIDLLEPISDTFLSELRKRGIKSKFLTPICKQFLLQN